MAKDIIVSYEGLGKIVATPENKIESKKKYLIKSLAFLQLVCMTAENEEDEKFTEFLDIVTEAANKARELYGENNDTSSIEQF